MYDNTHLLHDNWLTFSQMERCTIYYCFRKILFILEHQGLYKSKLLQSLGSEFWAPDGDASFNLKYQDRKSVV